MYEKRKYASDVAVHVREGRNAEKKFNYRDAFQGRTEIVVRGAGELGAF